MYRIGQRFSVSDVFRPSIFDGEYVLVQVDNFKVCLVHLKMGNRFNNPVTIDNPYSIDEKEFSQIAWHPGDFVVRLIEETNG